MIEPRRLAECFHVGVFIADEMEARDWTTGRLAIRMGGTRRRQHINKVAIDMCLACAISGRTGVLLGRGFAKRLEDAFGVPAKTWLALDAAWQAWATHRQTQTAGSEEPEE